MTDTNEQVEAIKAKLKRDSFNSTPVGKYLLKLTNFFSTTTFFGFHIFRGIFMAIYNIVSKFLGFFWKHYSKIWYRFAYDGERFSKKKATVTIISSIVSLYFIFQAFLFTLDLSLYIVTARVGETVYISNSQEIDAENNIHSVQGCELKHADEGEGFSCDESNSLYFRIESTTFNQVWSLWTKHSIFMPDFIAASVAPGWQKCQITSYGFRMKFFTRGLNFYPEILSLKCAKVEL